MSPVSVIIPTLNEEVQLPAAIASLRAQTQAPHEIIVVDGGSTDATGKLAGELGCCVLSQIPASRALQMNAGAHAAAGEILLFLHADCQLPPGAIAQISEAVESGCVGGGFSRRFDSSSPLLKWTCRLADVRGRWRGLFFGDQAIFVQQRCFSRLQGFSERPSFEDMAFSKKIRQFGRTCLLTPPVIASARRFDNGVLRTVLKDCWQTIRFLCQRSY